MKKTLSAAIVIAGLLSPALAGATTIQPSPGHNQPSTEIQGSDRNQPVRPPPANSSIVEPLRGVGSIATAPVQAGSQTIVTPMFKIEAVGFTAVDETGIDILGSDEPYAIWKSTDGAAASAIFGNVDSGDSRLFHEYQRCMYPIGADRPVMAERGDAWACRPDGGPGPIEFRVDMFEHDSFQFPFCFSGGAGEGEAQHPSDRCKADWIGGHSASWSEAELTSMLTGPGHLTNITVRLARGCADSPEDQEEAEPGANLCGTPTWEADYDFHYRITRLDDRVAIDPGLFQ